MFCLQVCSRSPWLRGCQPCRKHHPNRSSSVTNISSDTIMHRIFHCHTSCRCTPVLKITVGHRTFSNHSPHLSDQTQKCSVNFSEHVKRETSVNYPYIRDFMILHLKVTSCFCCYDKLKICALFVQWQIPI